jgi:hypothetical protein
VEAWPYFVHPNKPTLSRPYVHEDKLVFSNGYLAIEVDRFAFGPDMPDTAPEAFLERWQRAPWGRFDAIDKLDAWRPLDDAGMLLWKFGPKPIWEKSSMRYNVHTAPLVAVGLAPITLLPLVQLCARLPRAEAYTRGDYRDPVFIRFNGGRCILASFDKPDQPVPFSILAPRRDPLQGRGMNTPL